MSFLCSCTRKPRLDEDSFEYCYGNHRKLSEGTVHPPPAPTPRVKRKFPEGVGPPLPLVPSDLEDYVDKKSTEDQKPCPLPEITLTPTNDDNASKSQKANDLSTDSDSESDIDEVERTLLSICEQEEAKLYGDRISHCSSTNARRDGSSSERDLSSSSSITTASSLNLIQYDEDTDDDSSSDMFWENDRDDTRSITSQELEDLLIGNGEEDDEESLLEWDRTYVEEENEILHQHTKPVIVKEWLKGELVSDIPENNFMDEEIKMVANVNTECVKNGTEEEENYARKHEDSTEESTNDGILLVLEQTIPNITSHKDRSPMDAVTDFVWDNELEQNTSVPECTSMDKETVTDCDILNQLGNDATAADGHAKTKRKSSKRKDSSKKKKGDNVAAMSANKEQCANIEDSIREFKTGRFKVTTIPPENQALDLAQNSNVQDAFVIAVEQQARERLERLSALKRIKPVDMTKLSQQLNQQIPATEHQKELNGFIESSPIYVTSIPPANNITAAPQQQQQPVAVSVTPPRRPAANAPGRGVKVPPCNGHAVANTSSTEEPDSAAEIELKQDLSEDAAQKKKSGASGSVVSSGAVSEGAVVQSGVTSASSNRARASSPFANGRTEVLIGQESVESGTGAATGKLRTAAIVETNNNNSAKKLGVGEENHSRSRRRSGSSIVVVDAQAEEPVKQQPTQETEDAYNMMMMTMENGPHREMAVDVPDSFIARSKTPPRYPPPRLQQQVRSSAPSLRHSSQAQAAQNVTVVNPQRNSKAQNVAGTKSSAAKLIPNHSPKPEESIVCNGRSANHPSSKVVDENPKGKTELSHIRVHSSDSLVNLFGNLSSLGSEELLAKHSDYENTLFVDSALPSRNPQVEPSVKDQLACVDKKPVFTDMLDEPPPGYSPPQSDKVREKINQGNYKPKVDIGNHVRGHSTDSMVNLLGDLSSLGNEECLSKDSSSENTSFIDIPLCSNKQEIQDEHIFKEQLFLGLDKNATLPVYSSDTEKIPDINTVLDLLCLPVSDEELSNLCREMNETPCYPHILKRGKQQNEGETVAQNQFEKIPSQKHDQIDASKAFGTEILRDKETMFHNGDTIDNFQSLKAIPGFAGVTSFTENSVPSKEIFVELQDISQKGVTCGKQIESDKTKIDTEIEHHLTSRGPSHKVVLSNVIGHMLTSGPSSIPLTQMDNSSGLQTQNKSPAAVHIELPSEINLLQLLNDQNGSAAKPVPPPRDHLRIEKDGRLVNRAPAPQVPARTAIASPVLPTTNAITTPVPQPENREPTKEQLDSIRKYQEALRKRKEEEERVAQQNEFLNRSLRGSRKLQALESHPAPSGVVNDGYSSAEEAETGEDTLHRIIGYGELVASLQRLQHQLKKSQGGGLGYSSLEGQIAAVQTLLLSAEFGRALAVHNKVQEVWNQNRHFSPVSSHSQNLVRDCLETLQPCSLTDAAELTDLLTRYEFEGLLYAHDAIAAQEMAIKSPLSMASGSPPCEDERTEHYVGEDNIKIIKIEKTNEPLGATVRNEGDAVIIGRIVRGGAAEKSGLLHEGDEVLEVNGIEMRGKSVNDVCDILSGMTGTLTFLIVPESSNRPPPPPARDTLMHVKAHFDYDPEEDLYIPCRELGISFQKGDVLHVISQEDPNWWQAYREGEEDQTLAGLIPSRSFQHQRESMKQTIAGDKTTKEKSKKAGTLLCAKKNPKKKKKKLPYNVAYSDGSYPLYSTSTVDDYDTDEILTYEEVSLYYPRANHKRPIVLIGPPNIGRHELRQRLMEDSERFAAAIPHTSRSRKEGEVDGQDYHFITRAQFEADILARKFVEHGEYEKAYYGTSLDAIRSVVNSGKICVLNLHPQSLKILRSSDLKPYVVFVAPPSLEKLRQKKIRNGEAFKEDELKDIIEKAREMEDKYGHFFDMIIINNDTDRAYHQLLNEINSLEREPQWVPASWVKNT